MDHRNAPEPEQWNHITGGKAFGPALLEIGRIIQLLPFAAGTGAEGDTADILIHRNAHAGRCHHLHQAGRHDGIQS